MNLTNRSRSDFLGRTGGGADVLGALTTGRPDLDVTGRPLAAFGGGGVLLYPWVGVTPEIIKVCGVVCVLMVGWNIIVMVYVKLVAVFVCIVHLFETIMRYYEKFMKVFNAVKCFWKPRSPIPSVIIKNFKISHPSPTRPPSSLHVVETPAKPLMEIVAEPIAKPLVEVVAEVPGHCGEGQSASPKRPQSLWWKSSLNRLRSLWWKSQDLRSL